LLAVPVHDLDLVVGRSEAGQRLQTVSEGEHGDDRNRQHDLRADPPIG
jgi:hypothetical protein